MQNALKTKTFLEKNVLLNCENGLTIHTHVACFSFRVRLQNRTQLRICRKKKVLTVEGQEMNSSNDTDQGRVLICRRTFTVLDRTTYQGYHRLTLE